MGLKRISRVYLADDSGLRQIGTSSAIGDAALDAAQAMASEANRTGKGDYGFAPETVTAGWANERRHGAVVWEARRDWRDVRDTVLLNVLAGMSARGAAAAGLVVYTRRDGSTRMATQKQANNWNRRHR